VLPEASSEDLLYVTNYSYVSIYSYPKLKLVGTLKGFYSAVGECVDSAGNVFVTNSNPDAVFEYAHGGVKRIATLLTKKVGPVGCSVDATSGNLAVTGSGAPYDNRINIFKSARGQPYLYKDPTFFEMQFCGYDSNGNLFVDGTTDTYGKAALAELPSGKSTLVSIRLNVKIDGSGGIQWDGQFLAVGGYRPPKGTGATPVIYRFAIKKQRGNSKGTVRFGSPAYQVLQFYILTNTVLVPNWYYHDNEQRFNVLTYNYPAGGTPTGTLTKDLAHPRGVIVSLYSGW
jgi:hypothetical protein